MALDLVCGFDEAANVGQYMTGSLPVWSASNVGISTSTETPSGVGRSLQVTSSAAFYRYGLTTDATRWLGFYLRRDGIPNDGRVIVAFSDGGAFQDSDVQVGIGFRTDGRIVACRGRGLLNSFLGTELGTSTKIFPLYTWCYVEIGVTFSSSTGTVEVYVDGTKTGWLDLSSVDTTVTANNYCTAIGFGALGGSYYYDDVYSLTGSGGVRTGRLGPLKVRTVIASAGNGALADSTPSSGTDRGAMVDDATPDDVSTYNTFAAATDEDSYAFAAAGVTGTVKGLQVLARVAKSDAGTCTAAGLARIGGTAYVGSDQSVSQTWGYNATLWEQSPATAADWTGSEIDGAEFGVRKIA